jgi:hypothetical protein
MQGGDTHLWDLHTVNARKVYGETREATTVLKGHTAEVGGMDWANDTVSHPARAFSIRENMADFGFDFTSSLHAETTI